LDLHGISKEDDLEQTIDYSKVTIDLVGFVQSNTFDLIETLAEKLTFKLLEEHPRLQEIKIEVSKPEARINADFETVSVEITRGRHIAYLSLGSNIGDREDNLNLGLDGISKISGCRVGRVSNFANTAPYGFAKQDDFLNACVEIETFLTPHELLVVFREIENRAGRERIAKWGPRTLDIDIVYYDDVVLSEDDLMIPHIDMHNREFVLAPLAEIAPNKRHPILMKTTLELLDDLKGSVEENQA
jgi:dihydroneopterin aldolase/2-amino-4-hydroxy-6-hydroxymethyldihydropteridine diphosphokinase